MLFISDSLYLKLNFVDSVHVHLCCCLHISDWRQLGYVKAN